MGSHNAKQTEIPYACFAVPAVKLDEQFHWYEATPLSTQDFTPTLFAIDVWTNILKHVKDSSAVLAASVVCKAFFAIVTKKRDKLKEQLFYLTHNSCETASGYNDKHNRFLSETKYGLLLDGTFFFGSQTTGVDDVFSRGKWRCTRKLNGKKESGILFLNGDGPEVPITRAAWASSCYHNQPVACKLFNCKR